MKTINRFIAIVKPRQAFVNWQTCWMKKENPTALSSLGKDKGDVCTSSQGACFLRAPCTATCYTLFLFFTFVNKTYYKDHQKDHRN